MKKVSNSLWLGPLISGLLTFVAVCQINFYVSWACYMPFFVSIIYTSSPAKAFKKGFVFGAVIAFPAFYWMVPGAERFTGHSFWYGFFVMMLSVLLLSLYHAGVAYIFVLLKGREVQQRSAVLNALLAAAVFCCGEFLLSFISQSFPWFDEHAGSGLTANLYSIQPSAVFGLPVLSFVVILVNYLLASILFQENYAKLYVPAGILTVYMVVGFLLFSSFKMPPGNKPFTVAILVENIPPETIWNDDNYYGLGMQLLDLNKSAVTMKPDYMLWSECGIPWTYSKDDHLLQEVLRITKPAQATHILGINTAYSQKEVYNSAYSILPDGKVAGRYDKQTLLALIEKPLNGLIFPFLSGNGIIERTEKTYAAPLPTGHGKAGILICNEATVPSAAARMVQQGAQFFFVMSNDGWFNDTYIVKDHFYQVRLRAVETRKDIAINSNNGYSGLIKATGEVVEMQRDTDPFVLSVSVNPNTVKSLAARLPNFFVVGCIAYLFIVGVLRIRQIHYLKSEV